MFGGEVKSRSPAAGRAIKILVTLANDPKQAMWTGSDNAEKFLYFVEGMWMLASRSDRQRIDLFHASLYTKYGRGELGWYWSLDNHTGDPKKSLALYFKEMRRFFPDDQAEPGLLRL